MKGGDDERQNEELNSRFFSRAIQMERTLTDSQLLKVTEFKQVFRQVYGVFPDEILFETHPDYPGHSFIHCIAKFGDAVIHTRNVFSIMVNVDENGDLLYPKGKQP